MISSTYILTAAHCTRGFHDFEIGLGSIVLNAPITKIFTYSGAIEHPEFNPSNLNNVNYTELTSKSAKVAKPYYIAGHCFN